MNKNNKNKIKKITLSAILSAAAFIILLLGSFIEVLDLSCAALAGFVVVIAVIEIGGYFPLLIYAVASVSSILLLPNKLPALLFCAFAGFYPILKAAFERRHPAVAWVLKFSAFNLCLIIASFFSKYFIAEEISLFNIKFFVFLVANFVFLLYDICMSKIILLYLVKIRFVLKLDGYFN